MWASRSFTVIETNPPEDQLAPRVHCVGAHDRLAGAPKCSVGVAESRHNVHDPHTPPWLATRGSRREAPELPGVRQAGSIFLILGIAGLQRLLDPRQQRISQDGTSRHRFQLWSPLASLFERSWASDSPATGHCSSPPSAWQPWPSATPPAYWIPSRWVSSSSWSTSGSGSGIRRGTAWPFTPIALAAYLVPYLAHAAPQQDGTVAAVVLVMAAIDHCRRSSRPAYPSRAAGPQGTQPGQPKPTTSPESATGGLAISSSTACAHRDAIVPARRGPLQDGQRHFRSRAR